MDAQDRDAGRRQREAEFHDRQWSEGVDVGSILVDPFFEAVTAVENQHILEQFGDLKGKRILDYGCGSGEGGVYLAKRGARVVGVDVSAKSLEIARALASRHGVDIETRLVDDSRLPAEDDEFDLVYGNGVLHHVDLNLAIPELARVMKPNAKGCFIEPLPYNPAIDVYRRMATAVRTADETPLRFEQVEQFGAHFAHVSHREFWLTTLSVFLKFLLVDRVHPNQERYWKKIYSDAERVAWFFRPLRRLDERLLSLFPSLGKLCWVTVITLGSPRKVSRT